MTRDITTRILHADRLGSVEHGAVIKPLHIATAYGYSTAEELTATVDYATQFGLANACRVILNLNEFAFVD